MSGAATDQERALVFDVLKMSEPAFSVDMHQRIVAWNDAAEVLLGYRAEDVIGCSCCDVMDACRAASRGGKQRCAAVSNARRGRPTPNIEISATTRDGEVKRINVATLVARSPSGSTRVVHLLRDVSGYYRVGERVARALAHQPAMLAMSESSRIASPSRPSTPPTPREVEVLRLLTHGLAVTQIATTLSISPVTARNHVSNVMEKLGASTRVQAIILAAQRGLL